VGAEAEKAAVGFDDGAMDAVSDRKSVWTIGARKSAMSRLGKTSLPWCS
jgi:hypothetical protein